MIKRRWKSGFFNLISKQFGDNRRIGPVDSDMMPIALLALLAGGGKYLGTDAETTVPALSSRVATRVSWSPLSGLKGVQPPLPFGERDRKSVV